MKIDLRNMQIEDCEIIRNAFKEQGWNKPKELYEHYYMEFEEGKRDIIIAEVDHDFAGYLTILWNSDYDYFNQHHIPEIKDLNVLKKYQRQGIASLLMDEAEKRISMRNSFAGIGVGLMSDYGTAQRLYVKRGYLPDGLGISKNGKFLIYGDEVVVDDDLNLYLLKKLKD